MPPASSEVIPLATSLVASAMVRLLRDLVVSPDYCCMDRGHKHHDGTSEINIWLQLSVDIFSSPASRSRRLSRSSVRLVRQVESAAPSFLPSISSVV